MGADMLLAIAASPRMTSGGSDASVDVLCTRVKERAAAAASEAPPPPRFWRASPTLGVGDAPNLGIASLGATEQPS